MEELAMKQLIVDQNRRDRAKRQHQVNNNGQGTSKNKKGGKQEQLYHGYCFLTVRNKDICKDLQIKEQYI